MNEPIRQRAEQLEQNGLKAVDMMPCILRVLRQSAATISSPATSG
jgi:hypothetical protein